MKKKQDEKTNVMRILEQHGIEYEAKFYEHEDGVAVDGKTVAEKLGQDPGSVFKTLVTRSAGGYYIFDIPVDEELDMKKAAKAVGEKNVEMIHVAELLSVTGYVRGGCSPVGMKKQFPTVFHETAILYDKIAVSAGKIGAQVIVDPNELCRLVDGRFEDITKQQ